MRAFLLLILLLAGTAHSGQLSRTFASRYQIQMWDVLHANESTGAALYNSAPVYGGEAFNWTRTGGSIVKGRWGNAILSVPTGAAPETIIKSPRVYQPSDGFWAHCWYKSTVVNGNTGKVLGFYSGFSISFYASNAVTIEEYSGGWRSTAYTATKINDGKWHQIDLIKGAGKVLSWQLYVDGVSLAAPKYQPYVPAADYLYWFNYGSAAAQSPNAILDDMAVFILTYLEEPNASGMVKRMYTEALGRHPSAR